MKLLIISHMNIPLVDSVIYRHATHAYNVMANEIKRNTVMNADDVMVTEVANFLNLGVSELRLYEVELEREYKRALAKKYAQIETILLASIETKRGLVTKVQRTISLVFEDNSRSLSENKLNHATSILKINTDIETMLDVSAAAYHGGSSGLKNLSSQIEELVYLLIETNSSVVDLYLVKLLKLLQSITAERSAFLSLAYVFEMYSAAQSKGGKRGFLKSPHIDKNGIPYRPGVIYVTNGSVELALDSLKLDLKTYDLLANSRDLYTLVPSVVIILKNYFKINMVDALRLSSDLSSLGEMMASIKEGLHDIMQSIDTMLVNMSSLDRTDDLLIGDGVSADGVTVVTMIQYRYLELYFHMIYYDPIYNQGAKNKDGTVKTIKGNVFEGQVLKETLNQLVKHTNETPSNVKRAYLPADWNGTLTETGNTLGSRYFKS